jgi:hypothetical protein
MVTPAPVFPQRAQREAESGKAEAARLSREKEVLHNRLVSMQEKADTANAQTQQARSQGEADAAARKVAEVRGSWLWGVKDWEEC